MCAWWLLTCCSSATAVQQQQHSLPPASWLGVGVLLVVGVRRLQQFKRAGGGGESGTVRAKLVSL
jgi:hypothetical protein